MEIALLGGSFNPPHVGHLLAANLVRSCMEVEEVWLLPTYHHPFGKQLSGFEHRLAMCELLCADTAGWLKTSAVEREVGGEGWTVDTLDFLVRRHPDHRFHWIIGSDILPDLPRWRAFERIQTLANVVVLYRAGYPAPEAFGPPLAQVSSSEVRTRLSQGLSVRGLVPLAVEAYASRHALYTATS